MSDGCASPQGRQGRSDHPRVLRDAHRPPDAEQHFRRFRPEGDGELQADTLSERRRHVSSLGADGCSWNNIERTPAKYDWDRFDLNVTLAKANGVTSFIYTFGNPPDFHAVAPGSKPGLYVGENPNAVADYAALADFAAAVAQRFAYHGTFKVRFEPRNEVNDRAPTGFTGTLPQLLQEASTIRSAVKSVDPTYIVLTPNVFSVAGLIGGGSSNFSLDDYAAAGGFALADEISVHGYTESSPLCCPEGILSYARLVQSVAAKHGASSLPIVDSEWGFLQWPDQSGALRSDPMPDAQAAACVTRMILCSLAAGHTHLSFFALDDHSVITISLVELADPSIATLAGQAWIHAFDLLVGGVFNGLARRVSAGVQYYRATMTLGAGQRVMAYWCDYYKTTLVTDAFATSATDNLGNPVAIAAGAIAVTQSPTFVFYD